MKKNKLFIILFTTLFFSISAIAQTAKSLHNSTTGYTAIPDPYFEQHLIDLGFDSGPIDHQVLTSNITSVTELHITLSNISDLRGLQDFAALSILRCTGNKITTLDVTKNTALTELACDSNPLTTLDLSKNTALTTLNCSFNQLTTLDASNNTALIYFYCYNNQLVNLNVKNGNNKNMKYMNAGGNPNLSCVQADSTTPPNTNWHIGFTANYSITACTLSNATFDKTKNLILVYPNPINDTAKIVLPINTELKKVEVFSITGQKVETTTQGEVSLKHLSKGEYLFIIETNAGYFTKKIIKN